MTTFFLVRKKELKKFRSKTLIIMTPKLKTLKLSKSMKIILTTMF